MPSSPEPLRLLGPAEAAEPAQEVAWAMTLDDSSTTSDIIGSLALRAFVRGEQPYARSVRLERVRAEAPLLPEQATVLRTSSSESGGGSTLATGEGFTLRAMRWSGGSARVEVTAVSDELARSVLAEAVLDATEPVPEDGTEVEMGFWHSGQHGPTRRERTISTAQWSEIRANYPEAVTGALDRLMDLTADDLTGRLLLLHGPPGTGKTTLLRALARAWNEWCQVDCVLDPELLFSTPGYLMEVAVGDDDEESRRWRMLLLEDCDELIRGNAKESTGQGLSRLLNLTDGMLGQGRDVLVAITTNEDLSRLHPAVVRPGRCLAQLEIGRLPQGEALAWLERAGIEPPEQGIPADGTTLAELTALTHGERQIITAPPAESGPSAGFYL